MYLNQVFYDCVRHNDVKGVRTLVYLGADPNYRDALHYAIGKRYNRMAMALLKRGADPNVLSKRNDTALTAYLRILCERKDRGRSVYPDGELLAELVERTKDLYLANKSGDTAMMYCARLSGIVGPRIVEAFVKKGPVHSCKTESNRSDFFGRYRLMGVALMTLASPIAASYI